MVRIIGFLYSLVYKLSFIRSLYVLARLVSTHLDEPPSSPSSSVNKQIKLLLLLIFAQAYTHSLYTHRKNEYSWQKIVKRDIVSAI